MQAMIMQRYVFRILDLLSICISFVKLKSPTFHKSISLPLFTHHAASTFQMMWKLHTFIHRLESLSYMARKKKDAFFVAVAPSQLQNTVTHTIGWCCPQNDSSQLCRARRGARRLCPEGVHPNHRQSLREEPCARPGPREHA